MKHIRKWAAALLIAAAAGCVPAGAAQAASVFDYSYQIMKTKEISRQGTLVFSDCPEFVEQDGILAEGTVNGDGRVYYYHVNSTGARQRLVVYAESDTDTEITVTKFIQAAPSLNYLTTGGTLSFNDMVAVRQQPLPVKLSAGKRTVIASETAAGLLPDYLYSGIVEVKTEGPVRFGTAMLPMEGDIHELLAAAQPVPADSHEMRGTYPMTAYRITDKVWNTDTDGPQSLVIGGKDGAPFFRGMDELDGVERENTGDYGTTLRICVRTEGSKKYRIYFNPQGGLYMGAFKITQGFMPRYFRTDDMKFRGHVMGWETIYDYIEAGEWEPGTPIFIEFMAAGAANLPVRFLFVPVE